MSEILIDIAHADKVYESGETSFFALRDLSLQVRRGEFVAIVGSSGSGKSTLMNLIGCLDKPTRGTYRLAGHDVSTLDDVGLATIRNEYLAFVFQGFHLLARTSALENVELPLVYRGMKADERKERALHALRTVGLADRTQHAPSQLSGGQQQRVAVARALAGDPVLLLADEPTGNLDSRTTADILGLLQWLNEEKGLTILLVTHDPEVAAHTTRIVTVRDGQIASDAPNTPQRAEMQVRADAALVPIKRDGSGRASGLRSFMAKSYVAVSLGVRALVRNRLRGALTILGILIGIAAVVAMTTIGAGAKARVEEQMAALGVNMLIVFPGQMMGGGARSAAGGGATLTEADSVAIEQEIPAVVGVAPQITAMSQVVAGANNTSTRVTGTTPSYFIVRDWGIDRGALFDENDLHRRNKVCVVGKTVADTLFPEQDAVGGHIRAGRMPCTIIGVLRSKGQSSFGQDQDDIILVPLTTFRANLERAVGDSVQQISISAADRTLTDHVQKSVSALLRQRHRLRIDQDDDFTVRNLEELARSFDQQRQTITTLLLAVASIALFVGGIGVMNIMLVSVTERTREIGIRRAIGARASDVLAQFLVEAVILCSVGGLSGLGVGVGISAILAAVTDWKVVVQPQSALIAVGVSSIIGLVFGFFPARNAARLDPITALRHE
ncbi:MAG: ABC transporter permease [Sandaracinaceae bacterium]|nr:ABC transporter permease [Sandaracinaceae bacterium]